MLAISGGATGALRPFAVPMWDFFFFLSFGVVVTSSVTTAGVLLVFSFLIVPAVIGSIFSRRVPVVLLIAWAAGILARRCSAPVEAAACVGSTPLNIAMSAGKNLSS